MTGGLLDEDGKGESMITLAGTLEGIGLPALLRFLSTLRPDGRLLVADDVWGGEVAFDQGEVVAATFGAEQGLAALEAIALALPNGEFRFTGGPPPGGRDIDLPATEFEAYLTALAESQSFIARMLPSLLAVPQLVDPGAVSLPTGQDQVTIDRSTLYTLLLVDGQRSAHGICEWRSGLGAGRGAGGSQSRQGRGTQGIGQTLKELAWLAEAGLVTIEAPRRPPGSPGGGRERTPAASPSAVGDLAAARGERTRGQPPPDRLSESRSESRLPVNRPLSAGGDAEGGRSGTGTVGAGSRAPVSRPSTPVAGAGDPSAERGEPPLEETPEGTAALPADALPPGTRVADAPPAGIPAPPRARGLLPWLRFSAAPALAPAWPGRALFPAPAPEDRALQRGDSGGSGGVTLAGTEDDVVEGSEAALRYWRRTVILAVLAVTLLVLSWLQQNGWSGAWPVGYPLLTDGRQVTTTFQP
ncbi:MAG: DUF4388 domain-containing protein [Chloroflexota bacterium]|nr:DUF4388 domain-containing protein [Chloroflexota bacterium]